MEYNYNKKSLWKWILLYIIIGAVAYGALYYFFFYKKGGYLNEAAGWKTYTNQYAHYELQYPGSWIVQENEGTVDLREHNNYPNPGPEILVRTYNGSNCNKPFYDFVKGGGVVNAPDLPYTLIKLISIDRVNNSSVEGYKTVWTYSNPSGDKTETGDQVNFRNEKNCLIAEVSWSNNPDIGIVDKIVSTFKFMK